LGRQKMRRALDAAMGAILIAFGVRLAAEPR
jgi:threonine/homoserine/homoserine lactone efflux protein